MCLVSLTFFALLARGAGDDLQRVRFREVDTLFANPGLSGGLLLCQLAPAVVLKNLFPLNRSSMFANRCQILHRPTLPPRPPPG
jgi:hypothetical protein